jgi:hypothetical protein
MAARKGSRGRPASTPEGQENKLISLAFDVAEKQLREGSISSQVLTHFLKLGSIRGQAELEKLRAENILLEAKAESMASATRTEELISEALKAMRSYQGLDTGDRYDDFD